MLDTTVKHQQQFDETVVELREADHRPEEPRRSDRDVGRRHQRRRGHHRRPASRDNRPLLQSTVGNLEVIQQPLVDQKDQLNDTLTRLPTALKIIGRAGGIYGDFFNFYACDVTLKLNGLQPGGPVRTVKVWSQPIG